MESERRRLRALILSKANFRSHQYLKDRSFYIIVGNLNKYKNNSTFSVYDDDNDSVASMELERFCLGVKDLKHVVAFVFEEFIWYDSVHNFLQMCPSTGWNSIAFS